MRYMIIVPVSIVLALMLLSCSMTNKKQTVMLSDKIDSVGVDILDSNYSKMNKLEADMGRLLGMQQTDNQALGKDQKILGQIKMCIDNTNKRVKAILKHLKIEDPIKK